MKYYDGSCGLSNSFTLQLLTSQCFPFYGSNASPASRKSVSAPLDTAAYGFPVISLQFYPYRADSCFFLYGSNASPDSRKSVSAPLDTAAYGFPVIPLQFYPYRAASCFYLYGSNASHGSRKSVPGGSSSAMYTPLKKATCRFRQMAQ